MSKAMSWTLRRCGSLTRTTPVLKGLFGNWCPPAISRFPPVWHTNFKCVFLWCFEAFHMAILCALFWDEESDLECGVVSPVAGVWRASCEIRGENWSARRSRILTRLRWWVRWIRSRKNIVEHWYAGDCSGDGWQHIPESVVCPDWFALKPFFLVVVKKRFPSSWFVLYFHVENQSWRNTEMWSC